ncbi:hypothetical protein PAMA_003084 [Pampus argenteus]
MESFSGDAEGSTEEVTGRKKSKLKALKSRLFGRSKRAGADVNTKFSQSVSDITAGEGLGSDEDLVCSQGIMGSRALSHDSIFLADLVPSEAELARVSSQENVHSKIKDLQMKLQQQKMHLGPPPLVLPVRRPEELCGRSEDDGLPRRPSEISGCDVTTQQVLSKAVSQPSSRLLSPILKPGSIKSLAQTPSYFSPLSVSSNLPPSGVEPPLDFTSPVQHISCLDTSAARHRMSVKPRNQRASTKKRLAAPESHLHVMNNIDHPESMKEEEEQRFSANKEVTLEKEHGLANAPIISQQLPSKSPELVSITSEAAPKSSSHLFSQQDHVLPGRSHTTSSPELRVKPRRHGDVMTSERPHSSFIPSELKEKREDPGESEIQVMSQKEVSSDQCSVSSGSVVASESSSVYQQVQDEPENMIGLKRPAPGSGSFRFSVNVVKSRDGERLRSSSFVGVLEQVGIWQKTGGGTEDTPPPSKREKEECKGLWPREDPISVGRLRQEGASHNKSSVQLDRKDSLKKEESVAPSKYVTSDAGALKGDDAESSLEMVEEAVEGKTPFGVKLRSTSQSVRLRSDTLSNHHSEPLLCEEQCDKQKTQEINDNAKYVLKQSTSGGLSLTDPSSSGFSFPVKHNAMRTEVQATTKEVETALKASQEPQTAPQTTTSGVSWMSLAMEKTRSIQHLFTSRFPRQAAAQPQVQTRPTNQTETSIGAQIHTQTVKLQQSTTPLLAANQSLTDIATADAVQSRGQSQTVKSAVMPTVQQKTSTSSPGQSNATKELQTSKQVSEPRLSTAQSVSQPVSHPAVQINLWTTQQSPMRSNSKTDTTPQFAQANATRDLQTPNQPKATTSAPTLVSTTSTVAAPSPVSALEKESPSLLGERAVWAGSISEKAAFLEKRTEWTNLPGTKGVEVKKDQIEAQTSGESLASVKTTHLSKDTKLEGRQGVNFAESSPAKVPARPREDKWLRKNVGSSSSPSSSPTMPSALQSMSESGQPSWMELAKRKSMAWSDKTMD